MTRRRWIGVWVVLSGMCVSACGGPSRPTAADVDAFLDCMNAEMLELGKAAGEIGTPQKLFDIRTQWFVSNQPHNVEVADNGQKFLGNTIVGNSDNAPLEVTVNWVKVLK